MEIAARVCATQRELTFFFFPAYVEKIHSAPLLFHLSKAGVCFVSASIVCPCANIVKHLLKIYQCTFEITLNLGQFCIEEKKWLLLQNALIYASKKKSSNRFRQFDYWPKEKKMLVAGVAPCA